MRVVICGSLAHPDRLQQAAQHYQDAGYDVLVPQRDDRPAEVLDAIWRREIPNADLVVVVRKPDGSLGAATVGELIVADAFAVPVMWWEAS